MEEILSFTYGDGKNKSLPVYIDGTMIERVGPDTQYETIMSGYGLIYCDSGELSVFSDGRTIIVEEGSFFFGVDGKKYRYFSGEKGCRLKIIGFGGSGSGALLSYLEVCDTQIYKVSTANFDAAFRRIGRDVHMKNYFGAALGFQYMLYEIIRREQPKEDEKNVEILKRYIESNYCLELDNQKLAELYGTSVSYLCREFRAQYQISPMAYVNDLRVEKARRMLVSSRKKVAVIALECGFSNVEYFCYVFKKYEQCTPLQYRKKKSVFY